ncbi:Agd3-related carbohydrate-binding protein [Saccharothrix syringae]|nr:hypothetical protein [Saccharothrix syringae]
MRTRLPRSAPPVHAPLLAVLLLALGAITVMSPPAPSGAGPTGAGAAPPVPDPVPVAVPAKQRIPVRRAGPPTGPAARGDRVALRQLVVATGQDDFGLAAWRSVLDAIGTPYDVLVAGAEPLTADRLVGADGVGRYSAVLLTSGALLRPDADGAYTSALDDGQWQVLQDYERAYRVRQAALNTHPGTYPDDLCLRSGSEGAVSGAPVPLSLTPAGRRVFDHLRPEASVPLTNAYLYRTLVADGCGAEPLLSVEDRVAAVTSRAPDGRERLALTFSLSPGSTAELLLGHAVVRWANRGVLLGERRHWFNVDVDDWFNVTQRLRPDGTAELYRLGAGDAVAVDAQQRGLRERHPVAAGFTLNLPYNGGRFDAAAQATCAGTGGGDALSGCSKALVDRFRWINHTVNHPQMNDTPYDTSRNEITDNLRIAAAAGLPVPAAVLKTPEYSGLGVFDPAAGSSGPPTDFGLARSNQALLDAAHDVGVRYLHGNMSFEGHRPTCFNCGVHHPLRREVLVVPDWPTSIAFEATEPAEQVALYNHERGTGLTYEQVVAAEAAVALQHLLGGSVYAHTLHQGNLREYQPGRSLAFDWAEAVVAAYDALCAVPLENPDWLTLAHYVEARTAHFAELAEHRDAVWDRATGAVTYPAARDGALFVTGVETREATGADQGSPDEAEVYGSDQVSRIGLTAGEQVVLTASPRP